MKRLVFKMTLLTDVVIHADSATEGERKTLDFIPGSIFLGLVANKYDQAANPYDIFHSNKVRFGDAHPALNGNRAFKAPLSWFIKKGESIESERWVHHYLNYDVLSNLIDKGIQLKQIRYGWITPDDDSKSGKFLSLNKNFAIKSAYDRIRRTSAEGKLYGYKSLGRGTEWIFYVDIDESINEDFIKSNLVGHKHIGKSRSAQYGKVEIQMIDTPQKDLSSTKLFNDKYLVVYAESRLAFFDEYGQPTLQPTAHHFNLDENWSLDWSKSQVMNSVYAPYNFKNRAFLNDRVCFEKGSVFVFEKIGNGDYNSRLLRKGVGEYLNEGFGQVIINPTFLEADETAKSNYTVTMEKSISQNALPLLSIIQSDPKFENQFSKWLSKKEQEYDNEKYIYKRVSEFKKGENKEFFARITPSQWGQVRAVAVGSKDFNEMMVWLFDDIKPSSPDGIRRSQDKANSGILMHGKTEKYWRKGRDKLKHELQQVEKEKKIGLEYAIVLAAQMQKVAQKKENK